MMELPAAPETVLSHAINPGLQMLPTKLDGQRARMWLLAIALQEAGNGATPETRVVAHRWQVVDLRTPEKMGPARGILQFEEGTQRSRGGVWGVVLHAASRDLLRDVCEARGVPFSAKAIWSTLHIDDLLAVAVGRLLLLTDPYPLPEVFDDDAGWEMYAERLWRPGKPHYSSWSTCCEAARRAVRA